MADTEKLSKKSKRVLAPIAQGYSYAQILERNPYLRYKDIFAAAEEALSDNETQQEHQSRMAETKSKFPRAYERWEAEEDAELKDLFRRGQGIAEIAEHLGRQPSAIRSRLSRMQLIQEDQHPDS